MDSGIFIGFNIWFQAHGIISVSSSCHDINMVMLKYFVSMKWSDSSKDECELRWWTNRPKQARTRLIRRDGI